MALDYKPNEDFVVISSEEVEDAEISPSDEFWIFQFPLGRGSSASQFPELESAVLEFDDLDKNGTSGNFVDSSGTKFDLASYPPQDTESTVIFPSQDSTIAGSISRRVALVRYREPNELLQTIKARSQQKLVGAVTNSSGQYSNPTQSSRLKSGKHSASSRSSKQKSLFSSFTDAPKSSKSKHSLSSSGKHGISTSTVSGSSDRSEKSRKKKKLKMEE